MDKCYIGVDIGGTKIAIGMFGADRALLEKTVYPTDLSLSPQALTDGILDAIEALATGHGNMTIAGIGMGAPSDIDFERGYVSRTTNIPSLKEFDMRGYVHSRMDVPVVIDNDANVAALAEYVYGAGHGFRHMIYSTASTGIGGGLILNGRLFRGSFSTAGEIGHMLITPEEGALCGCGNRGCFESYAGGANIHKQVELRLQKGMKTSMTDMAGSAEKIDGRILLAAYESGDEMAQDIFESMCYYLGVLYYNLYRVLNVDCYVIGGGLTHFGAPFFEKIERTFNVFRKDGLGKVWFKKAQLQQDFGIIGAAELLFE